MENNLINEEPKKASYSFVDHIRCIAMIAIVAEHSLGAGVELPLFTIKYWVFMSLMQVSKFGTIAFFLLAGFLIGDKFTDYTPGQYLKRRFSNTFGPWLLWSGVYILCFIMNLHVKENIYHDGRFNLVNILDGVRITYLYSNYWFIINFMVSISLLLVFKRYLYTRSFGTVLFCFTLFYCINIHFEWIEPTHTTAILGFIFFLWTGAQLRKHWTDVDRLIRKVSYSVLILLVVVTYALAFNEMRSLIAANSSEPYNTLRFSNILYSLAVFALLLKIRTISVLDHLKPRDTTFGIYLIHYIVVVFATPEILRPLHIDPTLVPVWLFVAFKFVFFVVSYAITWLLVRFIGQTPARKLVGN